MNRIQIINRIIRKRNYKTYIEIGTGTGYCFVRIFAQKKIAVDPEMKISRSKKIKSFFKDPNNIINEYYEMTSDEFFSTQQNLLKQYQPDIIFIDGLHTYKQSLKDVVNSFKFIKPAGIILMHDCSPPDELSATPVGSFEEMKANSPDDWTGDWCGDVWKTIAHLNNEYRQLDVVTLDCDSGIGVLLGKPANSEREIEPVQIYKDMSFKQLENRRDELLNLKPPTYLEEFLEKNNTSK